MIAVVASLHQELAGIRSRAMVGPSVVDEGIEFAEAMFETHDIVLVKTGVGRVSAERAATTMLRRFPLVAVVNIGFCGALRRELKAGDVVVCDEFACGDSQETVLSDRDLLAQLAAVSVPKTRTVRGRCVTASHVVKSRGAKEELGRRANALVVDMESYWMARQARDAGVPFVAVRAVLDEMAHDLSALGPVLDPAEGSPFCARIVRHPGVVPLLPRLFFCMRLAQRSLWEFLQAAMETFERAPSHPQT